MYEHTLSPVAFTLGPLSVYWYGLVYATGFLFLYYYLTRYATAIISSDLVEDYIITAVISMLLGSRVFTFIFWYPTQLLADPLSFVAIWRGGMSFHGAYTGMVIGSLWFCRKHDISFNRLADLVSVPMGVFLGLGRIANFVNAELVGTPFNGAWCIDYPVEKLPVRLSDVCRHPYQLYAAAKNVLLTPITYGVYQVFSLRPGLTFWSFTALYNVTRFFVDIYRADPSVIFGFSTGQLLCLVFTGIASYMIRHVYKYDE